MTTSPLWSFDSLSVACLLVVPHEAFVASSQTSSSKKLALRRYDKVEGIRLKEIWSCFPKCELCATALTALVDFYSGGRVVGEITEFPLYSTAQLTSLSAFGLKSRTGFDSIFNFNSPRRRRRRRGECKVAFPSRATSDGYKRKHRGIGQDYSANYLSAKLAYKPTPMLKPWILLNNFLTS